MVKRKSPKQRKFASTYEQKLTEYFDEHDIQWEYEPIKIPWQPVTRMYKPDFKITLPSGEQFFLEAKGYFDGQARSKMIQVKNQHPDMDIRFVFMRGKNPISAKAKKPTTYEAWAKRYGFPIFEVPLPTESKKKDAKKSTGRKPTKRCTDGAPPMHDDVPNTSELGAQPVRARGRTKRAA